MVSSIVMVAPFTSEARTSTTTTKSGDFEYTLEINNIDDGTTWIEKYIGNDTKVIIPEEIKGRKVVGISSEAFKDCQQITDISIPNSVKKLGYKVFDDTSWYKKLFNNASDGVIYINNIAYAYKGEMPKNTTVTFDYGTVSIAGGAFWGEENLSKIILPNSLTYIGEDAFYCCENLNDFVIPNSLKSIDDYAFFECTNLTNIIIPDSVEYIGAYAFYGCWDLTNIVLGKGLNRINSSTFSYCTGLTSITIPDNINYIASEAFEDCYQLDNISISDNIFLIDADAFRNTKWYENQPDGVVYIGNFVYSYKGEMPENESINIKDGTVGIASGAFENQTNLSRVNIPCSVIGFGFDVFCDCNNLTIYGYKNSNAELYANTENINFVSVGNYSKDYEFEYKLLSDNTIQITKCIGTGKNLKIPYEMDGHIVSALGDYAFMGCANLEKVQFSYNVTKIGHDIFYNCNKLKDVYFIGSDYDWENIISATEIYSVHFTSNKKADETKRYKEFEYDVLDNNTIEITGYIGYDSEITVPDTINNKVVSSIGYRSFSDSFRWDEITTINFPSKLKNIGEMAFWNCSNIKEITIPDGVETIGDGAFGGTGLKTLFIPESVKYCDHLFDFQMLNEITVAKNNKNYYSKDGCLFRKSDNVLLLYPYGNERTEYNIPEGTTDIDYYAFFRGTGKLKTLTIPGSVKVIKLFAVCYSNSNKVILDEGTESIMKHAFENCKFKEIYIPKSVKKIEELAFGYDNMDSLSPEKIKNFKIYGYKGTVAETYAKNNGFKFVALSNNLATPSISSLTNTTSGIKLSWNKIEGAYGYRVYQKTSSGWSKLKDTTATSFTDSAVSANQTKTYTIRCINKNGKTISGYNSKGWSKKYTPVAPTISKLENTTGGIKLSWNKITGVYGYRVYQKTSSGWSKLKDTTATSFTDSTVNTNQTKTYTIRCIDKNGKTISGYNSKGWSKKYTPVAPTISKLENTTGGTKLTWNKITGVYGYRVYTKTSSGWKKLKDTTATSFTDSAVSANQTKTYTIRCIDKKGKTVSGYNSKGWSKKYTPVAPTISKLENTSGGIKLSWNKIAGVYGYRLYQKTSNGWKRIKDTTATSFTDSAVSANQTKTYTIRCIDKKGKTVSGFNSKGWSKKYTAATPKITKLTNRSKGVSVTWNKIAGVYGYRLYRKYDRGSWTKVKDTTSTSFTDSGAKKGKKVTYTVRCIDRKGKTVSGFNSKGWSITRK